MNFKCDACGRPYSIADEKVQGRSFRVTCRQCGHEIRVAATRPADGAPARAPAVPLPPVATAPVPPARPAPSMSPPPGPPPAPRGATPLPAPPGATPRPAPRGATPLPAPPPAAARGAAANPRLLTPPTTHVAGEGRATPAGNAGMTDDEMAWLAGGPDARPPSRALEREDDWNPVGGGAPPAEATAEGWSGTTTDAEAAAAALSAIESSASVPRRLDEGPDELPPLPGQDEPPAEDAVPAEPAASRGPGPVRIALAAVLLVAAAGVAAWQLGWLPGAQGEPAPEQPPIAAAAPIPPPAPSFPVPAPADTAPPVPSAEAPPAAAEPPPATPPVDLDHLASGPAAVEPPAPVPGPTKRTVRAADAGRSRKSLRLGRKDRRLLDLLEKKGDAAPVTSVEPSTLDTGLAALDAPAVERTLADNRPAFAACVTKALKADPTLRVDDQKATLLLTVRPNGTVSRAWIAEADLESVPLGRCLAGAARRMVFPAFQGDALDVAAPLVLGAIR